MVRPTYEDGSGGVGRSAQAQARKDRERQASNDRRSQDVFRGLSYLKAQVELEFARKTSKQLVRRETAAQEIQHAQTKRCAGGSLELGINVVIGWRFRLFLLLVSCFRYRWSYHYCCWWSAAAVWWCWCCLFLGCKTYANLAIHAQHALVHLTQSICYFLMNVAPRQVCRSSVRRCRS